MIVARWGLWGFWWVAMGSYPLNDQFVGRGDESIE